MRLLEMQVGQSSHRVIVDYFHEAEGGPAVDVGLGCHCGMVVRMNLGQARMLLGALSLAVATGDRCEVAQRARTVEGFARQLVGLVEQSVDVAESVREQMAEALRPPPAMPTTPRKRRRRVKR